MSGEIKGSFQTVGLSELSALLKSLADELTAEKILKRSVSSSAVCVQEDARSRAPELTGRLRASIVIRSEPASSFSYLSGDDYGAGVTVRVTAFYGGFVENGTRYTRPQPFLGPAFDAQKERFTSLLGDELGARIDQVWTSGAI